MNKITILTAFFLLFTFGVSESFAQRGKSKKVGQIITLNEGAKKNGYRVQKKGKKFFAQARYVIDPATKKLLEGVVEFLIRCEKDAEVLSIEATLESGVSDLLLTPCTEGVLRFAIREGGRTVGGGTISLTKDAKRNGYKLKKKGQKILVQVTNAVDPITKKEFEGLIELLIRCKKSDRVKVLKLIFNSGFTQTSETPCIAEDIEGEALASLVIRMP